MFLSILIFLITACEQNTPVGKELGSSQANNLSHSLDSLAIPENNAKVEQAQESIINLGSETKIETISLNQTTTTTLANLTLTNITTTTSIPSYCTQISDSECPPTCSQDNDYDCCKKKGICWSLTTFYGCQQDSNCTNSTATTSTTVSTTTTIATIKPTTTTTSTTTTLANSTTTTSTTTIPETTTTTLANETTTTTVPA